MTDGPPRPRAEEREPGRAGAGEGPGPSTSLWEPLRHPLFRALWLGVLASNVGIWMYNAAAAWLMAEITSSPALVALVQTATYLPAVLVGFLAGALADVADRRRLLLLTQGGMAVACIALGVLALLGRGAPIGILLCTVAVGLGTSMTLPAWQATIPETVSRSELPSAVTLNAASVNAARASGPALGGLIVAAAAPGYVFLLSGASILALMIVLYLRRWEQKGSIDPRERVLGAFRAGGRYVRNSPSLRAVLVRVVAFTLSGSAVWALLPEVARGSLGLESAGYGGLLGCLGLGALTGAALLSKVRELMSTEHLVATSTVVFACVLVGTAFIQTVPVLAVVLFVGGFAWIAVLSTLTTATTVLAPAWVRARALAAYLLVLQGGMGAGSAVWGLGAEQVGATTALVTAGVTLLAGGFAVATRWRLTGTSGVDLSPSPRRPAPDLAWDTGGLELGPVLVLVSYTIEPDRASEFLSAAEQLGRIRRRDGATRWGVFRDSVDRERYLESFLVESWGEYLRQRERLTVADLSVQEKVRSFHLGDGPPPVSRFIDTRRESRTGASPHALARAVFGPRSR
jgi:MFS family permease